MNNNTNLHQYFWERFQNEKRFLGFKVTKVGDQLKKQPIGVDGKLGAAIGDDSRLGTYEEAARISDYVAFSLTSPFVVDGLYLVCIDFDWKRAKNQICNTEALTFLMDLKEKGYEYEESVSGFGAHIWCLCKEDTIPKKKIYEDGTGIEVFSGFPGQRINVIFTNFEASGQLQQYYSNSTLQAYAQPVTMKDVTTPVISSGISPKEMQDLLMFVNADDRETWVHTGMIIKDEFGKQGFNIWNTWSQTSSKYNPSEMQYIWNSFKGGTGEKRRTVATLYKTAKDNGYFPARSSAEEDFGVDPFLELADGVSPPKNLWIDRFITPPDQLNAYSWLVEGFCIDAMTIFAGSPGVGKTSCLVPLACVVAGFQSHLSDITTKYPRKIIYLTEDEQQVFRLCHGIIKNLTLPNGKKITKEQFYDKFKVVRTLKSKPHTLAQLTEIVLQHSLTVTTPIGEVIHQPLVVFDTASATFNLDNENDNSEVSKYLSVIKEKFLELNIPVWIVAHIAKSLKREDLKNMSTRGASAFEGDANAIAYIVNEDGDLSRYIGLGKHRYEEEFNTIRMTSNVFEEPVVDGYGDLVTVGYRYSMLYKCSEEARVVNAEEAKEKKKNATKDRIKSDIIELIKVNQDNNINTTKSIIKKEIKGMEKTIIECLETMIENGLISQVDSGIKKNRESTFWYFLK